MDEFQKNSLSMQGEPLLAAELLEDMDIVIVTTAHTSVDYELVQKHARHVFDTKNAMKGLKERGNIELL